MSSFTETELREAVLAAMRQDVRLESVPDGEFTVWDVVRETGYARPTVAKRLQDAVERGDLRVRRVNLRGKSTLLYAAPSKRACGSDG